MARDYEMDEKSEMLQRSCWHSRCISNDLLMDDDTGPQTPDP